MEEDKPHIDPADVNDVETARLALRWALERIQKLQEDSANSNQLLKEAAEKLHQANEQLKQKEESLARWQSTVKAWDAHWRDQETMEKQVAERLGKEIVVQEELRFRVQRKELERHADLLQRELAEKESEIGRLRRQGIEAVQEARREKEKEINALLEEHARAMQDFRESMTERIRILENVLECREREVEQRTRAIEKLRNALSGSPPSQGPG